MATTLATDGVTHQTRFALRLASAISSNPEFTATNAAYSPLSLHVGLSLVAAGTAGATREQLVAVLGSGEVGGEAEGLHALAEQVLQIVLADASSVGGPRVSFANGVFVDQSLSLKPSFKELAVSRYHAEVESADFQAKPAQAALQVNSWVEKVTTGLIKDILPPESVDSFTRLVLSSALYFKGAWHERFDASYTRDDSFQLLDGTFVQTPFMSTTNEQYILYSPKHNLKILKLPYHQGGDTNQFSMYILLPETRDGLWSLAKKLSTEPGFIENHIPTRKFKVRQFKLPKFEISFGFEASDLLKCLGLELPFSKEADLSEMVDSAQNLYISSVQHRAFVQVNEEGTEAAAATATQVSFRSALTIDFVTDHPFMFLIREDISGVVLFVGHVVNPLLSS